MDNISEQQSKPSITIDEIMREIEQAGTPNDNEGGITLFKGLPEPNLQLPEQRAQYAANVVYDGMMFTLGEIGAFAVAQAKENSVLSRDYERVAYGIALLTTACRELADDKVPLARNTILENFLANEGDQVHAYIARNVTVGSTAVRELRVFIRPTRFERKISPQNSATQNQRRPSNLIESAQARMNIDIIPADNAQNTVSLRTDREDALGNYEIVYDIVIGTGDANLMDMLDFSQSDPSQATPGQLSGHHFSSQLKAEDLNTSFTDILLAYNQKFASNATGG